MDDSSARYPRLPWTAPLPEDPLRHDRARRLRLVFWIVAIAAVGVASGQFITITARNYRRSARADAAYLQALDAWRADPSAVNVARDAAKAEVYRHKPHKGAIARWARAVKQFWAGENIYHPLPRIADPLTGRRIPGAVAPPSTHVIPADASPAEMRGGPIPLHPNMPFVVILLTPLAYLPIIVRACVISAAKLAVLAGSMLGVASIANHRRHRMGDWVAGLGLLFALPYLISDIQHGNTNVFVLGAIVLHLWLYRRGSDVWSGAALALAICLKMTPALFVVYWLYQRNWRLLAATAGGLIVMSVVIPFAAMGPERFVDSTGSWLANLILPGLVRGAPYPIHINQSLSGVFSRIFMEGNIHFNPDDEAVAKEFGFINVLSLSPVVGRAVLTALRAAMVAVMAWAIGWRRLPRDDGRRALHFGLIVTAMLILNQRTWDHHATVLLPALVAGWYALAYGRFSRRVRIGCLVGALVAGVGSWLMGKSLFTAIWGDDGEEIANVVEAWGPTFACFAIIFVVLIVLLIALRKTDRAGGELYAENRIPLSAD